jgi:hypothetical protein
MKQLAQGRPRVVVWDVAFPGKTKFDDDFVAGVEELKKGGCEVIVGLRSWRQTPGVSLLSDTIAPHVKTGPMTGWIDPGAPWRTHLADSSAPVCRRRRRCWRPPLSGRCGRPGRF